MYSWENRWVGAGRWEGRGAHTHWERVSLSFCTASCPYFSYQHTGNTLSFIVREGG